MTCKWHVFISISFLLLSFQASAQYLSIKGDFQVDQQLGCNDLMVTAININPGTGTIIYQFNGSGSATTTNPIHTYTVPGTYWINQFIQGATGEKKDSISVIVVAPEIPIIELLSCNNLELLVQINDSYYDEYEINYGDGTILTFLKGSIIPPHTYANNNQRLVSITGLFTTATNRCATESILFDPTINVLPGQIDSLIILDKTSLKLDFKLPSNSINKLEVSISDNSNFVLFKNIQQQMTVDTITNLNFTQNTYCFRIATYDACSNFKSYSNEICSVNLTISAQNNQITIDWSSFDFGIGQITNIIRDGVLLQSFASPIIQHIDSTVTCNTIYCYQAEVNFSGGVSRSLDACETAFSNDLPPTINNISSITSSDSIVWTWEIPLNTTPAYYYVHEALEDGSLINKYSVGSNIYQEKFRQETKFIAVQLVDICDNESPLTIMGASLFLEGQINSTFDTELNWNDFFGWVDGFQGYYITIYNKEGILIDSVYTAGNTSYLIPLADQVDQTLTFTVWAIPVLDDIELTRSNRLIFERDPIIAIPNSFSPNGDGLNDKFIITGKFIDSFEMQIFNRWGEVLFHTTDLENGWDGTSKDKKMVTGNYAYWVRVKDLSNNEHIRTGSILILNN